MSDKLYINDDAPEEIKENVRLAQQCLDNMKQYKEKAENGTLTFADLENMVQKNHAIIDQFPKGNPAAAGLPAKVEGTPGILALAAARQAEVKPLLDKNPPVYKVDSIKDLHNLCQKTPEEIGETIIAAAKQKNKEKKPTEIADQQESGGKSPKLPKKISVSSFNFDLFNRHLEKTVDLLAACKQIYFDVQVDWRLVGQLEKQLEVHIDGLAEQGDPALEFLDSYVTDQTDDEDCEEKKPAAAFLMASIDDENRNSVERLLGLLGEDEELLPLIGPALKYSLNPNLNRRLLDKPEWFPEHLQACTVETLQYRGVYDPADIPMLNQSDSPRVQMSILQANVLQGMKYDREQLASLLASEDKELLEPLMLVSLLTNQDEAVWTARRFAGEKPESTSNLPLILSYAGDSLDVNPLNRCLDSEHNKLAAIRALGMLGLNDCVYNLLTRMRDEEWQIQKHIAESLELITGAGLTLPPPDIKEGPEGKEHEVEVITEWYQIWNDWWIEHHGKFQDEIRYRRGKRFVLGSCIEEMAYPLGNHWSRQGSYLELRIRSGAFVTHFEADWYVKDQLKAIEAWQTWWEQNQHKYRKSQWLMAGKQH